MAIRGPKPKADDEKVTRHALTQGWIEIADVPFEPQEEHLIGRHPETRKKWAAATLAWYVAISTMPHCILWGPAQWQYARTTAVIYDRWLKGDNARAGELRQREAIMGTTFDARRDLRIRYVSPMAFAPAPTEDGEPGDRLADFSAERRRRLMDGD